MKTQKALKWVLDVIICFYMLMILVLMPFYFQEGFVHIGTDKSTFLRVCSRNTAMLLIPVFLAYVLVSLLLGIRKKRVLSSVSDIQLSSTELFALAYLASVLFSQAFSAYKDVTLEGQEGWYMGTITQMVLVASFFFVGRLWERREWIPALALPVSAAVFALGILNRFGVYPFDMKVDNTMFISTIGNINWYCGYMVSVFFGGFALLWQASGWKRWKRLLLMAYVAVGFASLVTQGSSSGLLTLAVALLAAFCFSVPNGKRMCMLWTELVILSVVCLVICLVRQSGLGKINYIEPTTELLTNSGLPYIMTAVSIIVLCWLRGVEAKGEYPKKKFRTLAVAVSVSVGVLLVSYVVLLAVNTLTGGAVTDTAGALTFSPTWGSNRGGTWMSGVMCFQEQDLLHKLFGIGPDGMPSYLYADGSERLVELVRNTFDDNRLTNAHNEWLTILVNEGVFGFVSYVGMMVTAICRFLRRRKDPIVTACGFCLLAYTVNNMFSFQQAMNVATIFIVLGIGENYLRESRRKESTYEAG